MINALKYECSDELKINLENIEKLQNADLRINRIIQKQRENEEDTTRFTINKGILYHKTPEEEQIYLPLKTLKTLIWECHMAYGHTGAEKNYRIIKEHFY